jgi:hypothetical protein
MNVSLMARHKGESMSHRVCDNMINCNQVTAADIVPAQLFSSGDQFDVTVSSVQAEGGHFEQML